ncbi:glutamine--fructose-6-phosphate transaminase (isomerizing) [Sneathia sp. DSM 16631]|uniref:glutamine--fructose-6-phosphate transaminase (isomerizing) n=1 Tax=Sneathia TaxID=168808 RepID=UPI00186803AE|nr:MULTISPECIES: glutamine--fructose-6-phosphate transaminase (isomerizing) [Sneathia]MBE3031302.1 glutamine--fructose-6-phosphate transaminase (isomerizing) [Sneathia sp. DSM 16631]MDK9581965.1 glutamine--fructose-6-phosphate transaminase (isomerizing) [Sneathia vaginalis]
MCGIVGYFGDKKASDIILDGLSKLEYRGYDSAGIAVISDGEIKSRKHKGKLSVLVESLKKEDIFGHVGIGHTRWATHGAPSDVNSHPHFNNDKSIAVVHNGIIENYQELKKELEEKGAKFVSNTDTEVVAHLISLYYTGSLKEAVYKATKRLEGSYALGVICKNNPEELVAVRKSSPLILGLGENEYFIASDIPAILKYTREVVYLEDHDLVVINRSGVSIYDEQMNKVKREVNHVEWDIQAATKGGYDFFMDKEIHEQKEAVKNTIEKSLLNLREINIDFSDIDKIYIVACGTAYNAGTIGKYYFQEYLNKAVYTDIASEFRYNKQFIDQHTLVILVSQSGETADTLAVLRKVKEHGCKVLAVTNVVGSTISREADNVFYTFAGPEIAVASTKAYTTQIVSLYLIARYFSTTKEEYEDVLKEAVKICPLIDEVLEKEKDIKEIARKFINAKSIFYLGRSIDHALANEGALKLKEISYIHAESFAAGELKHGTIALIENMTPVVAIMTQKDLYDKMLSNIQEVKARGAYIVAVTNDNEKIKFADDTIQIPEFCQMLTPILAVIPLQILAYYTSYLKGYDVDKPRNLAKSVTVE